MPNQLDPSVVQCYLHRDKREMFRAPDELEEEEP